MLCRMRYRGVLWYPVRGPMGFRFGGYVLEVCVVLVQVGHLEGL